MVKTKKIAALKKKIAKAQIEYNCALDDKLEAGAVFAAYAAVFNEAEDELFELEAQLEELENKEDE